MGFNSVFKGLKVNKSVKKKILIFDPNLRIFIER